MKLSFLGRLAALAGLLLVAGCANPIGLPGWLGGAPSAPRYYNPGGPQSAVPSPAAPSGYGYRLGAGDRLRVIVFGQDDLGGQYDLDGSGLVRLPLIGQVEAGGLTLPDFENEVTERLADGYLKDPRVSIEVVNYRPFYIIGEVNKPGEYPYVNDMSILNAVALAGGYTPRADDSDVYIRRGGAGQEIEVPADDRTRVAPGDIVQVRERLF